MCIIEMGGQGDLPLELATKASPARGEAACTCLCAWWQTAQWASDRAQLAAGV